MTKLTIWGEKRAKNMFCSPGLEILDGFEFVLFDAHSMPDPPDYQTICLLYIQYIVAKRSSVYLFDFVL